MDNLEEKPIEVPPPQTDPSKPSTITVEAISEDDYQSQLAQDKINRAEEINNKVDEITGSLGNNGLMMVSSERDEASLRHRNPIPPEISNADLIGTLQPVFDAYKQKYGVDLKFDDLRTFINFANSQDGTDIAIKEVINSKLITDACDYIVFKGIMVAAKVIDSQLNAIQKQCYTGDLSVESMTVATSIFGWIEQLEALKEKYKQYNFEGKIESIMRTAESKRSTSSGVNDLKLLEAIRKSLDNSK